MIWRISRTYPLASRSAQTMIRSYYRYWDPVETAYHLLQHHEDNQHNDPNMPTYDVKRTIPSTPSSLVVAPELFGPSGNPGTVPGS